MAEYISARAGEGELDQGGIWGFSGWMLTRIFLLYNVGGGETRFSNLGGEWGKDGEYEKHGPPGYL